MRGGTGFTPPSANDSPCWARHTPCADELRSRLSGRAEAISDQISAFSLTFGGLTHPVAR